MGGAILKFRLKYEKKDNLMFISHLDLQKTFQRAFRRGNVPLLYSNGFNPHPKIHFAPPLPLFCESFGEYMDIETDDEVKNKIDEVNLKEILKIELPKNLDILEVLRLEENAKSLGKSLKSGIYKIEIETDENLADELNKFINESNSLILEKENKKGKIVEIDLKENVFSFKAVYEKKLIIDTTLSLIANRIVGVNTLLKLIYKKFPVLKQCDVKLIKVDTVLL